MRLLPLLPLLWFLVVLCALLPLPFLAGAAFAQSRPLPTYLQSGSGDLIRIQKGDALHARPMAPQKQTISGKADPARAVEKRLVSVCLKNASTASGNKGFDIRRNGPPRFVAKPGERICTRLEPTRHTVYFWKADANGKLSLTLTSRLDLSATDGTSVTLDWVQD